MPTSPSTTYPESQALWESVYQEARLFERPVVTFTLLLEASLNSGQTSLSELGAWLPLRGFTLTARLEAPNLLRDGQDVDVVQISPLYSDGPAYDQNVVLVIVEAAPGRYGLISPRDRWFHYAPGEEVLSIVDSNGNGRPEIASSATSWGHASCLSRLALYEWQGDYLGGQFANIAQGIEEVWGGYFNHSCQDVWSFGPPGTGKAQPVFQAINYRNWGGEKCPPCTVKKRYVWAPGGFQAGETDLAPLTVSTPPVCAVGWASVAGRLGWYNQAIPPLVDALEHWPAEAADVWGPSTQDYFRLKLGVWYAGQGETGRAHAVLQSVRDALANPGFDTASRLAAAYLDGYQAHADADAGCMALFDAVRYGLLAIPKEPWAKTDEKVEQAWGFTEPYLAGFRLDNNPFPSEFCTIQPALDQLKVGFEQAVRAFKPGTESDVTDWLHEQGLPVAMVKQVDLTGDGVGDWLIVLRTGFSGRAQSWALVEGTEGWAATAVPGYMPPELDDLTTTLDSVSLDRDYPHVNVLQLGTTLTLFRLARTPDGLEIEALFNDWHVLSYELDLSISPPQLVVQRDERVERFAWEAKEKKFTPEAP